MTKFSTSVIETNIGMPSAQTDQGSKTIDLALTANSVKDTIVRYDPSTGFISVVFPPGENEEVVSLILTSNAADWLSDQLGIQSIASRRGRVNPRKIIYPTGFPSRTDA